MGEQRSPAVERLPAGRNPADSGSSLRNEGSSASRGGEAESHRSGHRSTRADAWPFTHREGKTHRRQSNRRPAGPRRWTEPRCPGTDTVTRGRKEEKGNGGSLTSGTAPGAAAWVRAARPGRALGGRSGREAAGGSWGGEGRSPGPHWRAGRRGAERRPKPSVREEREPGGPPAALTALRAPRSPPGPRLGPPPEPGPPPAPSPAEAGPWRGDMAARGGAEPCRTAPQALRGLRFTRRSRRLRDRDANGPICWSAEARRALPRGKRELPLRRGCRGCSAADNRLLSSNPRLHATEDPYLLTVVRARVMLRKWRNPETVLRTSP